MAKKKFQKGIHLKKKVKSINPGNMQNHIYCFRNTCKDFINSVQQFEGSSVEKKGITILDKWPKTFQKDHYSQSK